MNNHVTSAIQRTEFLSRYFHLLSINAIEEGNIKHIELILILNNIHISDVENKMNIKQKGRMKE